MPTTPLRSGSKVPGRLQTPSWSPDCNSPLGRSFASPFGTDRLLEIESANERLVDLLSRKEEYLAVIVKYQAEAADARLQLFMDCLATTPVPELKNEANMQRALKETLIEEQVKITEMESAMETLQAENRSLETKVDTSRSYFIEMRSINDEMQAKLDAHKHPGISLPCAEDIAAQNTRLLADRARLLTTLENVSRGVEVPQSASSDDTSQVRTQVDRLQVNCQLLRDDNDKLRELLATRGSTPALKPEAFVKMLNNLTRKQTFSAVFSRWQQFSLARRNTRLSLIIHDLQHRDTSYAAAQTEDSGPNADQTQLLGALQTDIATLESRLSSKLRECLQLQERLKNELLAKETVLDDACKLCQQRDIAVASVKTLAQELESMKQGNTKLVSNNDMLSTKLTSVLHEYSTLQSQMTDLTHNFDLLQTENVKHAEKLTGYMHAAAAENNSNSDDLETLRSVLSKSRESLTTAHKALEASGGIGTDAIMLHRLKDTVEGHITDLVEQRKLAELERDEVRLISEEELERMLIVAAHSEKWKVLEIQRVATIVGSLQQQLLASTVSHETTTGRMQELTDENSILSTELCQAREVQQLHLQQIDDSRALIENLQRAEAELRGQQNEEAAILKELLESLEGENARLTSTLKGNLQSLDAALENIECGKEATTRIGGVLMETLTIVGLDSGVDEPPSNTDTPEECMNLALFLKERIAALKDARGEAEGKREDEHTVACNLLRKSIVYALSLPLNAQSKVPDASCGLEDLVINLSEHVSAFGAKLEQRDEEKSASQARAHELRDLLTESTGLVNSLQSNLIAVNEELDSTKVIHGHALATVQDLTKARNEYLKKCNNLQVAHDQAYGSLKTTACERDDLVAQLSTVKTQLMMQSSEASQNEELKQQVRSLTVELETKTRSLEAVEDAASATKEEAMQLRGKLDNLMSEHKQRESAAQQDSEAVKTELENKLAEVTGALASKDEHVLQLNKSLLELQTMREKALVLERDLAESAKIATDIGTLRESLHTAEVEVALLQQKLAAIENERKTSASERHELDGANKKLKATLEAKTEELSMQAAKAETEKVALVKKLSEAEQLQADLQSKLAQAEETLTSREEQVRTLSTELAGLQTDISEKEAWCVEICKEKATLSANLCTAEAELTSMKENAAKLFSAEQALHMKKSEIQLLTGSLEVAEGSISLLTEKNQCLEAKVAALDRTNKELTMENTSAEAKASELTALLTEITVQKETLSRDFVEVQEQAATTQRQSDAEQKNMAEELEAVTAILATQEEQAQLLRASRLEAKDLAATADKTIQELMESNSRLEEAKSTAEAMVKELQVERSKLLTKIDVLLSEVEAQKEALMSELSDTRNMNTALNLEKQTTAKALALQEEHLKAVSSELSELREELAIQQALKEDMNTAADEQKAELTRELSQVREEALAVECNDKAEINDLEAKLNEAEQTLVLSEEHVRSLNQELAELQANINEKVACCNELRKEKDIISESLHASGEKVASLIEKVTHLSEEKDSLAIEAQETVQELIKENQGLALLSTNAKDKVQELDEEQSELCARVDLLLKQKEELVTQLSECQQQAARAEQESDAATAALEGGITTLQEVLASREEQVTTLRTKLVSIEEQMCAVRESAYEKEVRITTLSKQIVELEADNRILAESQAATEADARTLSETLAETTSTTEALAAQFLESQQQSKTNLQAASEALTCREKQVQALTTKVAEAEEHRIALQNNMREKEASYSDISEEVSKLAAEKQAADERFETTKNSHERVAAELAVAEEAVSLLTSKNECLEDKVRMLIGANKELEIAGASAATRTRELQVEQCKLLTKVDELCEAEELREVLAIELEVAKQRIVDEEHSKADTEAELKGATAEIAWREEQVQTLNVKLAQADTELYAAHESSSNLSKKIDKLTSEKAVVEESLNAAKTEVSQKEELVRSLTVELETKTRSLEAVEDAASATKEEAMQLRGKLDNLMSEHKQRESAAQQDSEAVKTELENKLAEVTGALASKDEHVLQLNQQLLRAGEELNAVRENSIEKEIVLHKQFSKKDAHNTAEVAALNAKVTTGIAERNLLVTELNETKKELSIVNKELVDLNAVGEAEKRELDAAKIDMKDKLIEVRESLTSREEQVRALSIEFAGLQSDINEKEAWCVEICKEKATLSANLCTATTELTSTREKTVQLTQEKETLAADLSATQEQSLRALQDIDAERTALAGRLQATEKMLYEKAAALRSATDKEEATAVALRAELDMLEDDKAATKNTMAVMQTEASNLHARLAEAVLEIDGNKSEIQSLTGSLKAAEGSVSLLTEKNQCLEAKVAALDRTNKELTMENTSAEAKASELTALLTEITVQKETLSRDFVEVQEQAATTQQAQEKEMQALSTNLTTSEGELRTAHERASVLEREVNAHTAACASLAEERVALSGELDTAQAEITALVKALSEAKDLAATADKTVQELVESNDKLEEAKSTAEAMVKELQVERSMLLTKIDVLLNEVEAQKEALMSELASLRSEATRWNMDSVEKEEEVKVLGEKYKILVTLKLALEESVIDHERQEEALSSELEQLKRVLTETQTKHKAAQESGSCREAELQKEIEELKEKIETEKQEKVQNLSEHYAEINRITGLISEEVEKERMEEREIRKKLEVEVLTTKNEKRDLEARSSKEISEGQYAELVKKVQKLSQDLNVLHIEKGEMEGSLKESNIAVEKLQFYVEKLEQRDMQSTLEINKLQDEVNEMTDKLEEKRSMYGQKELLNEFQAEKEALQASKKEVQARNMEYRRKIETLEQTASSLMAKNREMEISLDHASTEEERLRQRVGELIGILSSSQVGHSEAMNNVAMSESSLLSIKEELKTARSDIITLTNKPPNLENEKLQSDVAALSRCNTILQTEVNVLNSRLTHTDT